MEAICSRSSGGYGNLQDLWSANLFAQGVGNGNWSWQQGVAGGYHRRRWLLIHALLFFRPAFSPHRVFGGLEKESKSEQVTR
jgi:hypothetical protein